MMELSSRGDPTLYDLLIFDWDGTAVVDRKAPIPELIGMLEQLLHEAKVICVVVTGTHVDHLLDQGLRLLSVPAKQSLYLCTNRGSEVWGFTPDGRLTLLYKREATSDENHALDQAAILLQKHIQALGVQTQVTLNRLNRRKIDLIPEPTWSDPKKAQVRELFRAVQNRLKKGGITEGITQLIEDSYRLSRTSGLTSPRITSDIKHIEIGLTDKSDSARWALEHLIKPRNIPLNRVAIIGDEFGSIGGIQGSDALLQIPELKSVRSISVGVEPEGVPSFVEYWGGGPEKFLQFLKEQALAKLPQIANEEEIAWQLIQEGFEPSREREMETLFSIGNGYVGVRGSSDFTLPSSQADLFLAGIYDRKAPTLPYSEVEFFTLKLRTSLEAEIVPFPSPFQFHLRVAGALFTSEFPATQTHTRTLSMKDALYQQEHLFEDSQGRRTRVHSVRIASLSDPHLLIQKLRIHCENYSAPVEISFSSPLDDTLYPHLELLKSDTSMIYKTKGSNRVCCMASKAFSERGDLNPKIVRLDSLPGQILEFYRITSLFTDRDEQEPQRAAMAHLAQMKMATLPHELRNHSAAWEAFWSKSDIQFQSSLELRQAQRFNLYHLRIAADRDPRVSIPAKALTGRAYEGHVFWDTDIFMFPFFLYTEPEIAKNLILYRYNTLAGAKKRATEMGFRGACYAWESTVSGEDVTPKFIVIAGASGPAEKETIPIFTGAQQIHITADVAYAVWKYWDATQDLHFLATYGAEILVETARFWMSRISQASDGFHILSVVGPDEYHHGVDDNTYTNWMARLNLKTAAWACRYLQKQNEKDYRILISKMALTALEIESWQAAAQKIYIPKPDPNGILEQFQGFHRLRAIALREHERQRAPISRLFHWKEINTLQLIKQADLLMIPFLFPDALPPEQLTSNYDYYEPMTDHGSSLSLGVHAAIAARIGRVDQAQDYWEKSLNFDLTNAMSNTALGIHAASMGAAWQALVFHILGVSLTQDGPKLANSPNKNLLSYLGNVSFQLIYRGQRYPLSTTDIQRKSA